MIGRHPSPVVRIVCTLLAPFILVFGLYVTAHGHYGPGGGFAGGVVLAVGVILLRVTIDAEVTYRRFPVGIGLLASCVGMGTFLVVGLLPLAAGGMFLDYGALAYAGLDPSALRYAGILVVELAIGLAVFGAMILIFDVLVGEPEGQD
jgi:multicomponent Na+:H+ antiporter subunit B